MSVLSSYIALCFGLTMVATKSLSNCQQSSSSLECPPMDVWRKSKYLLKKGNSVQLGNTAIPVNYGAYTNGTFIPTSFQIPKPSTITTNNPAQVASFYSFGGGVPYNWDVSARRMVGGGNRSTIYGSARWGSGDGTLTSTSRFSNDTFHPNQQLGSDSRSYPYGFWPVYWGSVNYGMSLSSLYSDDSSRPGGAQHMIIAGPEQTRQDAFYYVVGDNATIAGLNTILKLPYEQGGCAMWEGNPIYLFEPDNLRANGTRTLRSATGAIPRQNVTILPTSALQYYRSSSVMLGANVYENAYSMNNNTDRSYWGRTPFNVSAMLAENETTNTTWNGAMQQQARFLDCLNQTIAAAIPIIDPELTKFESNASGSSSDLYRNVGIGVGAGLVFLILVTALVFRYRRRYSTPRHPRYRRVPLGRHTGGPRVIVMDRPRFPVAMSQAGMYNPASDEEPPVYQPLLPERRHSALPPPYSGPWFLRENQG